MKLRNQFMKHKLNMNSDGGGGGGTPPADPPPSDSPPADPPPADPPSNWFDSTPDTWRQDMIAKAGYEGDDAGSVANLLERVTDPGALLKNYREAQLKISKGEISTGLPENATEEQITAYREANGIPPAADKYELQMPEGVQLNDDMRDIFKAAFEPALNGNVSNSVMNEMVAATAQAQQQLVERQQQQDGIDVQQATTVLKENWQGDYQTNLNMVDGLMNQLPEAVRDSFRQSRMADGRGMMNTPEVMQFFADMARKLNPSGTVVPGANNPVQAINDEIASLEARMGEPDWHKDTAANNRLMQLYEAQERMNK